jgi:hypothetical protein
MSKQTAKRSAPPRYDDAFKQGAIQMLEPYEWETLTYGS